MQLDAALLFQERKRRKRPSQSTKKKICSGPKAFWELILLIHYQIQFISIMGNCSVGLRVGEHKNISVRNIRVGEDCIRFEENGSKSLSWRYSLSEVRPSCCLN